MDFPTEQERFWREEFGNEYVLRNRGPRLLAANTALFSEILGKTSGITSVLELGCNIGMNLVALERLLPDASLTAVEINRKACEEAALNAPEARLLEMSILEFQPTETWDFVFTKGVLIHVDPEMLPRTYDLMHAASRRYIMVAEYYNPKPVEVEYRGHSGKLFKRDFAGDLLDRFEDLRLVDYGFTYHRDANFPQDDGNWFLLEKR